MSDVLPQIEPETQGRVTKLDVPIGKYLGEAARPDVADSMWNAVSHTTEDEINQHAQSSRQLTQEEANQKYSVGNLKFDGPTDELSAQSMNERERNRMDQLMYLYSGATKARFLPGMAAGILGATANPLDLGTMFIPFVGEGRAVGEVGLVSRMLSRGLIPAESIAKAGIPLPRLVGAMAQATMWQGLAEVPKIAEAHVENQPMPYITDEMLGQAAFAGILHGVGAGLRMLRPETHDAMSQQTVNDFLQDRDTSSHEYVPLDEHVIEQQAEQKVAQESQEVQTPTEPIAAKEQYEVEPTPEEDPKLYQAEDQLRQQAISDFVDKKKQELNDPVPPEVKRAAEEQTVSHEDSQKYNGDMEHLGKQAEEDIKGLGGEIPKVDPIHDFLDRTIEKLKSDFGEVNFDPFLVKTIGKPVLMEMLKIVSAGYKAGKSIFESINQAVDHVKKNYPELLGKLDVRKVSRNIEETYAKEQLYHDWMTQGSSDAEALSDVIKGKNSDIKEPKFSDEQVQAQVNKNRDVPEIMDRISSELKSITEQDLHTGLEDKVRGKLVNSLRKQLPDADLFSSHEKTDNVFGKVKIPEAVDAAIDCLLKKLL